MSNKTSTHEPGKKPKWLVVEEVLYYQSKAGDELRLDLDFPSSVFEKIGDGDGDREQFLIMLEEVGDTDTLAKFQAMGALEQGQIIVRYFHEFTKAVRASLGESAGSSDS